jgi:hypothetical protein
VRWYFFACTLVKLFLERNNNKQSKSYLLLYIQKEIHELCFAFSRYGALSTSLLIDCHCFCDNIPFCLYIFVFELFCSSIGRLIIVFILQELTERGTSCRPRGISTETSGNRWDFRREKYSSFMLLFHVSPFLYFFFHFYKLIIFLALKRLKEK